ncbi:hypothetical protein HMPREF0666_03299 [Prevotella sp. C561]|jgi:hypothetical protein|uniref:hypothetical protein n=1 Tax=Prevotella sp. C561 TaxID=563031 RepID=UPI00022377A5|nr:hypothetical protein [Prevotella sp. C561]EGW48863.1 hypothetical protein HMPREF0666_03299 [Prevotella sp. C561]
MKPSIFSTLIILTLFTSCAIQTHSLFPIDKIHLSTNKISVINICGKPFRSDSYINKDKKIDILYYKEPARVLNQGFIITTILTFENDSLVAIKQYDKNISNIELSLDSIYRK